MSNKEKARQRQGKFSALLRDMFQLDQPELDFGLYRIMQERKDDINRFIELDLPRIAQDAFADFFSQDQVQVEQALARARQASLAAGFDPDTSPEVRKLQEQLQKNFDMAREEGEVYDALITFFSRYYDEGDFISRRMYKDGTYAIPYQGEEVLLHWANKEQYYIKSTETLRDYSFRLNPDAAFDQDPLRVHFKLVDAQPGAKDNNKEADDSKRVFVLDAEQPFELIKGKPNDEGTVYNELHCRFFFRQATQTDWMESVRKKATATAQKKEPEQSHLLNIAEVVLLDEHSQLPEIWKTALLQAYRKADGELADYSVLIGQLNNYTKKNTSDYFIHKNLGDFLTRELDFYIKNELMEWSDLVALKNDPARLAPILSKLDVVRRLGGKIISFLAQLEDFQKKLWLKKKFVTEAHYCITLDRLEGHDSLLRKIFTNDKQLQEWQNVYGINADKLKKESNNCCCHELLKKPEYRYMMVDTGHFTENFKAQLLATIHGLDNQTDGLLIQSENFQAARLLHAKLNRKADLVYLDPPYNTDATPIVYKNGYKESSWASLMFDRNNMANMLVSERGVIAYAIDDTEVSLLKELEKQRNPHRELFQCVVEHYPGSGTGRSNVSRTHEYCLFSVPKNVDILRGDAVNDGVRKRGFRRAGTGDNNFRIGNPGRPESFFAVLVDKNTYEVKGVEEPPQPLIKGNYPLEDTADGFKRVYPIGENGEERVWSLSYKGAQDAVSSGNIISSSGFIISRLYHDSERRLLLPSIWQGTQYNATTGGTNLLTRLFGVAGTFSYPKSIGTIERVFDSVLYSQKKSLTIDFFGGSGTTAHAAINRNRRLSERHDYVLIEMGAYFDTVLKPRVAKAVYSADWQNGAPTAPETGISHCFKYMRLESYEDTLGNLVLQRNDNQKHLFEDVEADAARQAYIMNYMLDVETRGSQSLLNIGQFLEPTRYSLKVRSAGGEQTVPVNVDLLETFNCLLGLEVEYISAPSYFDAQFVQTELGRWQAKITDKEDGKWWFRTVYGMNRNGQAVLIVWRNLPSVIEGANNGIQLDNAVLDAVLMADLKVHQNEHDGGAIDLFYVNGDHNIHTDPAGTSDPVKQVRVQLIEEVFHRLMFADTETAH